jgi:hypothetical protein
MKNLEEDILKRFLQDTFSDYEPEPIEQTWENIRKEIQPHQPNVGAGMRRWVVPVVALLLLVSGLLWDNDNKENNTELAINSKRELLNIETQIPDYQKITTNKPLKLSINNTEEKSEKIYVNKTTSKVESKALPEVEKSFEVPTFSTILTDPIAKPNVQEYSVSTKEFVGINDKSSNVTSLDNSVQEVIQNENLPIVSVHDAAPIVVSVNIDNPIRKIVSMDTDNNVVKDAKQNSQLINETEQFKENNFKSTIGHQVINDAVIEEVRYIKPLETLKNKDFALIKNELVLPQITEINLNREAKPIRRPVYMSVSVMPLQTYRILTVNRKDIQNLLTNNLFDSERNGWAFELGITKPIGNKWNLRSSISYLKMRQWAEYQVNTENISVKNSNNYSTNSVVVNNENEYIGQTRIEAKTLQMVGLKADVQKFFKVSGRNRYFISGGSQLMVEPSEKRTNAFINASAGFQHMVNKDCFLTIEPTASYLLNNINDSKSLIQTNAYNLGLKVGVNFKVK